MRAKEIIPASKPRNFVAKNQKTAGAGAHKDKKKAAKQGDVKHKGKVEEGIVEGESLSIGQQMARDGITYSPEKEKELINLMGDYMEKDGYNKKQIRYYLSYDEDFISDQLAELPRKDMNDESITTEGPLWKDARYADNRTGFSRRDRADDWDEGNTEPPNNFAVYINGKKWKVFKGRGQYADDAREKAHHRQLQDWARQKSDATGKKWEVHVTGEAPTA